MRNNRMYDVARWWLLPLFCCLVCGAVAQQPSDYANAIADWQQKRTLQLGSCASPLALAGMFWLEEGENSFGKASDNRLVFPVHGFPAHAGKYILRNDSVLLELPPDTQVVSKGKKAVRVAAIPRQDSLKYNPDSNTIVLEYGSVKWFLMVNAGRLAIRLLDCNNEPLQQFKGVERFPVDASWRVSARFEPYAPGATISVTNVFGGVSQRAAAGKVYFNVADQEYVLEALDRDGRLFFVFSDATADAETYAFRFLYAERPTDGRHITELDFNKATNPNCAFSSLAPCPVPSPQNRLPVPVRAGEKKYRNN